jgi:chromosomal replication initiation ATPase DnaA
MSFAEDMERRISRALDGKFFLPDGRDMHLVKRQQDAMRVADRAEAENKQRDRRRRVMAQHAAKMELRELTGVEITPRKVLVAVSYAHGIPIAAILGPERARKIIYARQHACHAMRHLARMKFPAIGDELARDHTTVLHSCTMWERIRPRFAAQVEIVNSIVLDGKEVPA